MHTSLWWFCEDVEAKTTDDYDVINCGCESAVDDDIKVVNGGTGVDEDSCVADSGTGVDDDCCVVNGGQLR